LRTLRTVLVIDCCSWVSAISRFFWLTSSCWRVPSILKLRSSGCVYDALMFAVSCGSKLV
jgi:hypothetical protein